MCSAVARYRCANVRKETGLNLGMQTVVPPSATPKRRMLHKPLYKGKSISSAEIRWKIGGKMHLQNVEERRKADKHLVSAEVRVAVEEHLHGCDEC